MTIKISNRAPVGNTINAASVNGNRAVASMTLREMQNAGVVQPSKLKSVASARGLFNGNVAALVVLHTLAQRPFKADRKKNAGAYADYMLRIRSGQLGGTPAINLFCDQQLVMDPQTGALAIPYGALLFAIDGETQLEGRFINAARAPETADDDVALTIWHGIQPEHAMQIVHDFNAYGSHIPEKELATRNVEGAIMQAVQAGIDQSGFPETINTQGTSLRAKKYVASTQSLLAMSAGIIDPKVAIQHGGFNRILTEKNHPTATVPQDAIADTVAHHIGLATAHKELYRSLQLPVWLALGAASGRGRKLSASDVVKANAAAKAAGRGAKAQAALSSLKTFI